MRRFRGVILLALSLLALPAQALDLEQQPFAVRTLPPADAVHAIAQAPDGMLWFGSRVGLVRFDGERFVEVPLDSAGSGPRPDTWVRRLRAARDGSIWVATGSASLELTADAGSPPRVFAPHGSSPGLVQLWPQRPPGSVDRVRRLVARDGLPDPWVWALAEDGEGAMWVGTERGLVRFTGPHVQRFTSADGLPSDFVTALIVDRDELYVGTSAGVAVRRGGRFHPLPVREPVMALARDRTGRLWVAVHGRLLRLDADGRLHPFAVERATSLAVDHHDQLWVGGCLPPECERGATVALFAGGAPLSLTTPLTPFRLATDLLVDREGSVWLGLREGGVTQLTTPAVRNLGPEEGLSGPIAFSVRHASDGSTYVATTEGISRYLRGSWTTWRDGDDSIGSGPRDITEGPAGTPNAGMWFASEGHLLRGGARGFERIRLEASPFNNASSGGSRSIVIARNGDVFLARTNPLALLRLPGGDVRLARVEFEEKHGLCPGKLTHGLEAADGALWFVGDYGGQGAAPTRIKDGQARCLGTADGLPDVQTGAITEDREGAIWLGTGWGAGLIRYKDGQFQRVPQAAGLPSSSIVGLLDDGRGFLWICSESGVWRASKQQLHRCADQGCVSLNAAVYGKAEGMRSAECMGMFHPNLTLDGQGYVWAATLAGATRFAPPGRAQRPVLKPVIEEIAIDGAPVAVASTVSLGARRSLLVRYTVPTFVGATRPRLRHRLAGVDADWVVASAPAAAHYHDLAAGRYVLELAAGDHGGEVTVLTVMAAPPFWRTPTFLVAMLMLLGMLGFALHLGRMSRMSLRHRATNEERLRIARELHDGLAQKLRAVGLLTDRLPPEQGGEAKIQKMRRILSEAHAELRRAIWDMREGTGSVRLEPLIEQLLSQLVVPPETEVNLETAGQSLPVPSLVAQEVKLVAKEALVNALAHAHARRIDVGVLSDEEGLHLWVRDDGRGGLPSEQEAVARGRYGLLGMLERARRLGGVVNFRSEAGRGTEVSLFLERAQMRLGRNR